MRASLGAMVRLLPLRKSIFACGGRTVYIYPQQTPPGESLMHWSTLFSSIYKIICNIIWGLYVVPGRTNTYRGLKWTLKQCLDKQLDVFLMPIVILPLVLIIRKILFLKFIECLMYLIHEVITTLHVWFNKLWFFFCFY
jgi:hypothetical protein